MDDFLPLELRQCLEGRNVAWEKLVKVRSSVSPRDASSMLN